MAHGPGHRHQFVRRPARGSVARHDSMGRYQRDVAVPLGLLADRQPRQLSGRPGAEPAGRALSRPRAAAPEWPPAVIPTATTATAAATTTNAESPDHPSPGPRDGTGARLHL